MDDLAVTKDRDLIAESQASSRWWVMNTIVFLISFAKIIRGDPTPATSLTAFASLTCH
ncbi:hypothetical protein IHQ72_33880 [Mesorhizobium onobrychidis]|uniref:Uncharacterized protein n=1 Tax=Mesorhizobium onobrychidis TaxID=2775404 RepID=A0ABY5QWD4_9HYPH|nr:hypothetical protein [Mesorhizobium onobrychidis]UVC15403.1 hypothetical protein IHQ72_33880 [Mesorhizobium onobrychidis]